MLKNYLITAFRILLRQRAYSAINIFGLTLGIAACLLIILYIMDELRYDRFHPDVNRMYRVGFEGKLQGNEIQTAQTGAPTARAFAEEAPGVEAVVRILKRATYPVRLDAKSFTENNFLLADSNFFKFFNFKLVTGNPHEVLRGPGKAVISEATAKKYFGYTGAGDTRPLGKIFSGGSNGETTFEVTGIAENPPSQSHIQFDFVLSMESDDFSKNDVWVNTYLYTYIKLHEGASPEAVRSSFNFFVEKYIGPNLETFLGISLAKFREQGSNVGFYLQHVPDIHLRSNVRDEISANGNIQYIYLFGIVALLIILLACINFMNLSTARSANRAKEVGIRKTVGALRQRLMGQFLLESYIYVTIAIVFALALVSVMLPLFNELAAKRLTLDALISPWIMTGIFIFVVLIGLLSGSYPAFYLTSFRPVDVLKGKVKAGMKSSGIRNALVVFQFSISIGLIISSIVVYHQLNHLQNVDLGFRKDHVINLLHTRNLHKNAEAFRHELEQDPKILAASFANRLPPNMDWTTTFRPEGRSEDHLFFMYFGDHDHLKTMGYTMVKGRYFSREFPSDSTAVVLNETCARQLGWYDDFEQRRLLQFWDDPKGRPMRVIGIMKDFNFESLRNSIKPVVIFLGESPNNEMAIRIASENMPETIKTIESILKKYAPQSPFEYSFLDENFDALFRAEQRMAHVILIFTCLAILIACLGLFGLASFSCEQRRKEIGIRKVMGASVFNVTRLLSKDFLKLVIIAIIISVPSAWYLMDLWLQNFPYRVPVKVWMFLVAGLSAIVIALITVSFQSIRSAMSNPVESLRSE